MKRLAMPSYDDQNIALTLADNQRLSSFPYLRNELHLILSQYNAYVDNSGNPWSVPAAAITPHLANALRAHYDRPPTSLTALSELRSAASPDVCPMCGSFNTGTLDHVFPKIDYPEFSIYTKNLVPACNCNSLRASDFMGVNPDERVLHPYFDDCMQLRLVSALFEGDFTAPTTRISICCGAIPEIDAVVFHIGTILNRTNILRWLEKKWSMLIRRPESMLINLPAAVLTELTLRSAIEEILQCKDDEHETPNNWHSIFFSGLLASPDLIPWLVVRINDLRDGSVIAD